ncbi:hypothetical protein M433DRAFT_139067 [Acidomyces richmondensis BFW]|nr:MAG: hypothetical protein FE78DRAFT_83708 [Acidomyces sp. 'richmondensis']KYG50524.1 hypothetical protein M433DRAFT_139067 [Acidomyces richmondensis BFW]
MPQQKTAYVTGAASGIARAVTEMLVGRGYKVAIADIDHEGVKAVASQCKNGEIVAALQLNAADWNSQVQTFEDALRALGGRIDYVYPIAGIGERMSIPNDPKSKVFVKPDLSVLDVDLYGFLYTTSLAIQQMRRQEKDEQGFRGKIAVVASVCGFYCVPTLPMYTAAKHAVVGFVRSFGKYLPEEDITLNAVCPNVIRTNISTSAFYDTLEARGLLTPMKPVIDAFETFLDEKISGECLEVGPTGEVVNRAPANHLDQESTEVLQALYKRGHALHEPKSS